MAQKRTYATTETPKISPSAFQAAKKERKKGACINRK